MGQAMPVENSSAVPPAVDWDQLVLEFNEAGAHKWASMLSQRLATDLPKLDAEVEAGDLQSIAHDAHKLKGVTACTYAVPLSRCFGSLERAAKQEEDRQTLLALLKPIHAEAARVQRELADKTGGAIDTAAST